MRGARTIAWWAAFTLIACEPVPDSPTDVVTPDVVGDTVTGCGSGPACVDGLVCDVGSGVCVGCVHDGDCLNGVCHPTEQACVACLEDEDCSAGRCHPLASICVQCLEDQDCAEGVCDADALQCIGCLEDSDCESGVCNPSTRSCVGCASAKTCDDGDPCTVDACLLGECTYDAFEEGAPCDDGDLCTVEETCLAGACVAYLTSPECCEPLTCDGNHTPTDTDKDGCPDGCAQSSCKDSEECDELGYCFFEPEQCGLEMGLCVKLPQSCKEKFAQVCGCDGVTYVNACEASLAQQSVLHEGPCEPTCEPMECPEGTKLKDLDEDGCGETCVCPDDTPLGTEPCDGAGADSECLKTSDCKAGMFCLKPDEACDAFGKCEKIPQVCEELEQPVCGCDGLDYESTCQAQQAGVSLAQKKTCK